MAFQKHETPLPGLLLIKPDVYQDKRGYFKEQYSKRGFLELGLDLDFVQDNLSFSEKGAIRGLHFQAAPFAQGKLVMVLQGEVFDVNVDIRKNSPAYGKWHGVKLSADNHQMLYIPPGFAHGFSVLSENCLFQYKCTNYYNKSSEGGIMWNDPDLKIDWKVADPLISEKDLHNQLFESFETPFLD